MPIEFTCPHCGKATLVADQYAGQTGPCASCGEQVTVPTAGKASGPTATRVSAFVIVGVVVVSVLLCAGIGSVAMLAPAVGGARGAAQRMQCSNNLKQISIALLNYHDVHREFPPAYTVDENGNKLHSWRTLILPYLEQDALYRQIDFDKPWDDPANIGFASMVIPAYQCPSDQPQNPAGTSYMAVVGPETMWPGETSTQLASITDGTSNTLMVVEVRDRTNSWMEPVDLDYDKLRMMINGDGNGVICSHHANGANVAMGDGSVTFIADMIDSKMLRAMLTAQGGEDNSLPQ